MGGRRRRPPMRPLVTDSDRRRRSEPRRRERPAMDQFVRDLVTGSVSGAIYALIAAGLVLTYATTGIFNLGYAGISFSSAFLFFELNTGLGLAAVGRPRARDPRVLPAARSRCSTSRSSASSRARPKPPRSSHRSVCCSRCRRSAPSSLGRGITALRLVDTNRHRRAARRPASDHSPARCTRLFSGVVITSDQIIVLVTAILCVALLWVFLRWTTKTGLRMRAVADRHDLALDARDQRRADLAAGVGARHGARWHRRRRRLADPAALDPNTYSLAVFVAIAAAVVGGFRSVLLAFAGAIFVAVASNLTFTYATFAQRHARLQQHRAVPPPDRRPAAHGADTRAGSRAPSRPNHHRPTTSATSRPGGVAAPERHWRAGFSCTGSTRCSAASGWALRRAGLIFSLIFLSFTIVTGVGGMVSLAQAAFVSGAGLLAGALDHAVRLSPGASPHSSARSSRRWLLGVLVALPSMRLGGVALALATLALGIRGRPGASSSSTGSATASSAGRSSGRCSARSISTTRRTMAGFVLLLIFLVVWLIKNLERSNTRARDARGAQRAGCRRVDRRLTHRDEAQGVRALGRSRRARRRVARHQRHRDHEQFSADRSRGCCGLRASCCSVFADRLAQSSPACSSRSCPRCSAGSPCPSIWRTGRARGPRKSRPSCSVSARSPSPASPTGSSRTSREKNYERRERRRQRRIDRQTGAAVTTRPGTGDADALASVVATARRGRMTEPKLAVERLEAGYGPVRVVHGMDLTLSCRHDHDDPRAERGRQVDHVQDVGRIPSREQRHHRPRR